jgi:autotransporter-associated beta strand protein
METSTRQSRQVARRRFIYHSFAGRFALSAVLALAIRSAPAANYTWIGGTGDWSSGAKWTTEGVDDATFPDDSGDNVIGNTSAARAELSTDITINNLTTSLTNWTIDALLANTAPVALTINGTFTNPTGIATIVRSNTALLSLSANQITTAANLTLGSTTATTALENLTVSAGLTISGGVTNISVNNDYSLGLITHSGSSIIQLTNGPAGGSGSRTIATTGIEGSTGTMTIRPTSSVASYAATLDINNSSVNSTHAVFTNGGTGNTLALEKQGIGTQTLAGASTYTGGTAITGGTILANNTTGSALGTGNISVGISGTLGGTGSVAGVTTVSGAIAPGGTGIGGLAITNHVTWNGGADWKFELGIANASDRLNITGAGSDFLKGPGSVWRFDFQNTGVAGNTYTLVDWVDFTTFTDADFSSTNLASGLTGSFVINGSQLDFVVVPEPSTWSLLGVSFATLLATRRHRAGINSSIQIRLLTGGDSKNAVLR